MGRIGYHTEYALTLKDGIAKLEEYKPNIILLDVNLPDGSGLGIIPMIRKLDTTFFVISAYEDKKSQALSQGASGFLKKPFELKHVTNSIAAYNAKGQTKVKINP